MIGGGEMVVVVFGGCVCLCVFVCVPFCVCVCVVVVMMGGWRGGGLPLLSVGGGG